MHVNISLLSMHVLEQDVFTETTVQHRGFRLVCAARSSFRVNIVAYLLTPLPTSTSVSKVELESRVVP